MKRTKLLIPKIYSEAAEPCGQRKSTDHLLLGLGTDQDQPSQNFPANQFPPLILCHLIPSILLDRQFSGPPTDGQAVDLERNKTPAGG
jgi:hypothetical protein